MHNTINICISSDERFIELGAINLFSIVYYSKPETFFNIFIIDNGIKNESKEKLKRVFPDRVRINYLYAKDIEADVGMNIDAGRWTLSTFQRLYISDLLPNDIDRVLYLDCDMLVRAPLDDLFFTSLEDNYIIAGVSECISERNKINIGLSEDDNYINAGMLLIDLCKWRQYNIRNKSLDILKCKIDRLKFLDQDLINIVLKNRIKIIPLKFNAYTALFNYNYRELLNYRNTDNFYDFKNYIEAINNPVIVHFTQDTGSIRPWFVNGRHKFRDEWLFIRNKTSWCNNELWKDSRSINIKIKHFLFNMFPRRISVELASILNNMHAKEVDA